MGLFDKLRYGLFKRLGPKAQALVDAAVLAMLADKDVQDIELDAATCLLGRLPWFSEPEPHELRKHIQDSVRTLREAPDMAAETRRVAATFDDPDAREVMLGVSAYVVLAEGKLDPLEDAWVLQLATLLGFDQARVAELVEDIREYRAEDPNAC